MVRILRLAGRVGALDGGPAAPVLSPQAPDSVAVGRELRGGRGGQLRAGPQRRHPPAAAITAPADGPEPAGQPESDSRLRIAVIGPNAEDARTMGGGSATVFPPYTVSPLDGLRAAGLHVTYAPGVTSHLRAPPARAPWLLRPGQPVDAGTEVRFLTATGDLARSELRDGATFLWPDGFAASGITEPVARVQVRCVIRATAGGVYQLGVSGVGRYRLAGGRRGGLRRHPGAARRRRRGRGAHAAAAAAGSRPAGRGPVGRRARRARRALLRRRPGIGPVLQLNLMPPYGTDDEELAAAAALAAASDAAVVVVGTTADVESEGFDRTTLALPGRQDELVRQVIAANPRTVVVVNSGAPVLLPWAGEAAAVLLSWFGGQEYGNALADVLLGDAEPGGRLPMTWPASEDGLPSAEPVGGVLSYTEGLFIGYRALRP